MSILLARVERGFGNRKGEVGRERIIRLCALGELEDRIGCFDGVSAVNRQNQPRVHLRMGSFKVGNGGLEDGDVCCGGQLGSRPWRSTQLKVDDSIVEEVCEYACRSVPDGLFIVEEVVYITAKEGEESRCLEKAPPQREIEGEKQNISLREIVDINRSLEQCTQKGRVCVFTL